MGYRQSMRWYCCIPRLDIIARRNRPVALSDQKYRRLSTAENSHMGSGKSLSWKTSSSIQNYRIRHSISLQPRCLTHSSWRIGTEWYAICHKPQLCWWQAGFRRNQNPLRYAVCTCSNRANQSLGQISGYGRIASAAGVDGGPSFYRHRTTQNWCSTSLGKMSEFQ